jgi:hypothetical protein
VAYVDKDDVSWVFWVWEIGFCDAIAEGDGGGVVDDTEGVETCDGSCVEDGSSLYIGIPAWDGDDDVADTCLELCGCCISKLTEIHAYELCGREGLPLAEVIYLPEI